MGVSLSVAACYVLVSPVSRDCDQSVSLWTLVSWQARFVDEIVEIETKDGVKRPFPCECARC
eukprot:6470995-Amphidinium_carterae.1